MPAQSRSRLAIISASFVAYAACGDNFIFLRPDAGSLGEPDTRVEGVASGFGGGSFDASGGSMGQSAAGRDAGGANDASVRCTAHAECLDNDSCNGIELCVDGSCLVGAPLVCNDGNPCSLDTCAPLTGACDFVPIGDGLPCADGDLCDGQVCLAGKCADGSPVVCGGDVNPCTEHVCDPATGACLFRALATGATCSDGNACNGAEACAAGICLPGFPLTCDDANPCTLDACDAIAGCFSTNAADGTACVDNDLCNGTETCLGGACQPGVALSCSDGNVCTTDVCNPFTGACTWAPLPNGVRCPDGNVCDGQACLNGGCVAAAPVVCAHDNDNNPCTASTCTPATGICAPRNVLDGSPCPDGNFCDGTETCVAGACAVPGAPLICPDDGNFCTTDVCVPAAGCLHLPVPDGMVCPDADLCDGTEICAGGSCTNAAPVACSLPLTCSPLTGECQ